MPWGKAVILLVNKFLTTILRSAEKAQWVIFAAPAFSLMTLSRFTGAGDIHKQFLPQLKQLKVLILFWNETVSGVYSSVPLGRACGAEKRAAALTGSIKKEWPPWAQSAKVSTSISCFVRIKACRDADKLFLRQTLLYNELIKLAGGKNSLAFDTAAYPHVASGTMKINPDIIIDLVGDKNFIIPKTMWIWTRSFNKNTR